MSYYYVYKITDPNTRQFYIGSRKCNCLPKNDDYMGSMVTWEPEDKNRLQKEILKDDFNSLENAIEFEARLIKKNWKHRLNENYNIPNKSFAHVLGISGSEHHNYGRKHTDEEIRKISEGGRGLKRSDETCRRISENHVGFLGQSHTKEAKRKIGESVKKRHEKYGNPMARPVRHIETGLEFYTGKEASEYFGIHSSTVNKHCKGVYKTQKFQYIE